MVIFKKIGLFLCVFALILLCFVENGRALTDEGYEALHNFAKVLHYIEDNYSTEVDEEVLIRGAIRGMVGTLDAHSVYMSPEIYRELQIDTRGRFDGIGVEVTVKNGNLTVVSPIQGTPADEKGLEAGDEIIRIDGHDTRGLNLSEAVSLMRGKRGSRIKLTVQREGLKDAFTITLIRRVIKVPSVTAEVIDGKILYLKVINFQQSTGRSVAKEIKNANKENNIEGIILDLRKNPGGLLEEAVAVSDLFLSDGVIVTTETRGKEVERFDAHSEDTYSNIPILVLIDGGSASASEIVAGALKDTKRAIILGEQSFGKGTVQTVIDLDDGSGLKLTIARYLTPSGKAIHGEGIAPDIIVGKQPKPKLVRGQQLEKDKVKKYEGDYQLDRAVDYLKYSKDQKPINN